MIKLTDKYYLDFDRYNYILYGKSIVKDKKSPKLGQETHVIIGYYSRFSNLIKGLIELDIREAGEEGLFRSLNGMDKRIKDTVKEVQSNFDNVLEAFKKEACRKKE